jgi:hypothetical protein
MAFTNITTGLIFRTQVIIGKRRAQERIRQAEKERDAKGAKG